MHGHDARREGARVPLAEREAAMDELNEGRDGLNRIGRSPASLDEVQGGRRRVGEGRTGLNGRET